MAGTAQRPSIQALEGAAPSATAFALSIEWVSDADGNGSARASSPRSLFQTALARQWNPIPTTLEEEKTGGSALGTVWRVIPRRSQNGVLPASAMNSGSASRSAAPRMFRAQRFGVRGLVCALGWWRLVSVDGGPRVCGIRSRRADKSAPPQSGVKPPQSKARRAKGPAAGAGSWAAQSHKRHRAMFAGFLAALPMMSSERRVPRVPHSRSQGLAELVPPIGNHHCGRRQNPVLFEPQHDARRMGFVCKRSQVIGAIRYPRKRPPGTSALVLRFAGQPGGGSVWIVSHSP